ncbi:MAG: hypothetical protein JJV97_04840, partial [SAR324 cluster bacterium]|nr:hypothetical protein [SAR324 cluster bacterium]
MKVDKLFLSFLLVLLGGLFLISPGSAMGAEEMGLSTDLLMQALPERHSVENIQHFVKWKGLGMMAFGGYLIGVSISIFAVHQSRVASLTSAELIICSYLLWFILFPYIAWLIIK